MSDRSYDGAAGGPKPRAPTEPARVVVVTGLSGAGKSTALRSLEDLGYFCADNVPTSLVGRMVEVCEEGGIRRVAVGVDVRVGSFFDGAAPAITRLREGGRDVVVLFLDASEEALLRRFNETRRPHPLTSWARGDAADTSPAARGALAVLDGVRIERERLAPLRAQATVVLDTTLVSVHELRRQVIDYLGPGKASVPRMLTRIVSFGFKYGAPIDADVMLDVRLLTNPFFVPALRDLPGTSPAVRDFLLADPEVVEFRRMAEDLLAFSLPRYEREGKSYLTVGIGCTGGRHRSVALAALLAEGLMGKTGLPIVVLHRDVAREGMFGTVPPRVPP
jgi:RNase adapter protein RapZ